MSEVSDLRRSPFKPITEFLPQSGHFGLLPFRFIRLDDSRYVLTNFAGEYIVTDRDNLVRFVKKDLAPDSDFYAQTQISAFLDRLRALRCLEFPRNQVQNEAAAPL